MFTGQRLLAKWNQALNGGVKSSFHHKSAKKYQLSRTTLAPAGDSGTVLDPQTF
jgi:hypothetical protein